jgi:hypothetical protein
MPGKMASTTVRAARRASSRPHLAAVLREGRKSANIYASLGFIRGIPDKDPFHYRRSEMAAMTSDLPWDVAWSGDWEHPRDQNMMILERLPNAKSARTNQSGR